MVSEKQHIVSEFVKKYCGVCGYSYNITANMITRSETPIYTEDQLTPYEAKALAAFSKLLKLRRDWIGTWNPDWSNGSVRKYYIEVRNNEFYIDYHYIYSRTFSFPTKEMAEEFLECFKDLFEECKDLI